MDAKLKPQGLKHDWIHIAVWPVTCLLLVEVGVDVIQGFKILVPEMRVYTTYRYAVVRRHSEIRGSRGCFVLLEKPYNFKKLKAIQTNVKVIQKCHGVP